jgi:hypothetical protein
MPGLFILLVRRKLDVTDELTDMGLLGDTAHLRQNAVEVEIVKPKQTTSRKADKVVRANGFACFVILPQLQGEFPIRWQLRSDIPQFADFLNRSLDFLPQRWITHIGVGINWLEARLSGLEFARERKNLPPFYGPSIELPQDA